MQNLSMLTPYFICRKCRRYKTGIKFFFVDLVCTYFVLYRVKNVFGFLECVTRVDLLLYCRFLYGLDFVMGCMRAIIIRHVKKNWRLMYCMRNGDKWMKPVPN